MPEAPLGSLAWIEAELRERFGAGAVLGALVFEGRRLRVEGAKIPIGAALLEVDVAVFELGAGLRLDPLPLAARLVSLRAALRLDARALRVPLALDGDGDGDGLFFRGSLRIAGATFGAASFSLQAALELGPTGLRLAEGALHAAFAGITLAADLALDLAASGSLSAPSLRGPLRAAAAEIRRGDAALRVEDLTATLDLDPRRLRYEALAARAHGAHLGGWGRVPFRAGDGAESVPLAALSLADLTPALAAAAAPLAGLAVRVTHAAATTRALHVPPDLVSGGELMLRLDGTAAAAFLVTTPRTELRLRLSLAGDGGLVGSTLRGRLGAADAVTFGIFAGVVRPRPEAVLDLDARLGGTLFAPSLAGRVSCPRFLLDVSADPAHPSFLVDDASVLIDVDRDQIAWSRFTGRFYGGTFASSGRFGFAAWDLDATLSFTAVRVEHLPTDADGRSRFADLLHGAATGEVHFERHAFADALLSARGKLHVLEPRYLAVRALAPTLARYSLPRVRSRGRGPLAASLRLERDTLHVDTFTAAVEGVDVSGAARIGLDGRLGGNVQLLVHDVYLAQSPLFLVPAAFAGKVAVPVELGGTVMDPALRADARAVLEKILVKNRLGDAVKGVFAGLRARAEKPGEPRPRRRRR
jgi:hypothetical protein